MTPPVFTFTNNTNTVLQNIIDFGIITNGITGSSQIIRLWNNLNGVASTSTATNCNLSVHDQGARDHATWSAFPQTGWMYARGRDYNTGITGSFTGSADNFLNIFGPHYGINTLTKTQSVVSGSTDNSIIGTGSGFLGSTGSYWEIEIYLAVPSTAANGSLSGSLCLSYSFI
jgi:hypothetical protein